MAARDTKLPVVEVSTQFNHTEQDPVSQRHIYHYQIRIFDPVSQQEHTYNRQLVLKENIDTPIETTLDLEPDAPVTKHAIKPEGPKEKEIEEKETEAEVTNIEEIPQTAAPSTKSDINETVPVLTISSEHIQEPSAKPDTTLSVIEQAMKRIANADRNPPTIHELTSTEATGPTQELDERPQTSVTVISHTEQKTNSEDSTGNHVTSNPEASTDTSTQISDNSETNSPVVRIEQAQIEQDQPKAHTPPSPDSTTVAATSTFSITPATSSAKVPDISQGIARTTTRLIHGLKPYKRRLAFLLGTVLILLLIFLFYFSIDPAPDEISQDAAVTQSISQPEQSQESLPESQSTNPPAPKTETQSETTYSATIARERDGITITLESPLSQTQTINIPTSKQVTTTEASGTRYEEIVHTVVKGDTLWFIAKRYVHDAMRYPELARLSKINNPHLIYPGDRIRIRKIYRNKPK